MPEVILKLGRNKLLQLSLYLFHITGMWPNKDSTLMYVIGGYIFQCLTTFGWTLAKCVGTLMLEKRSEIIMLVPSSLFCIVAAYRGFIIMWRFSAINECLTTIFDFALNETEYEIIQKKLKTFSKSSSAYISFVVTGVTSALLNPILSDKKVMPIPIWLPYLNWENDPDYYIGLAFSFSGILVMVIVCAFTPVLVWYLLYASSLMLEALGYRLQKIGHEMVSPEQSYSELVKHIRMHHEIISNINKIKDIFSSSFLLQIITSAFCICSVTYLMASESLSDGINNFIMYFSLLGVYGYDIAVLIYYANEISLVSDELSFRIYESNWTEMPVKTRKIIVTNQQQLQQPLELVVGKMFPMRIKLLSSILNLAYSIFNVLGKEKR